MQFNVKSGAWSRIPAIAFAICVSSPAFASDLLTSGSVDQLATRTFWETSVPVPAGDHVVRTVLLDENLYVLTSRNLAFAVHAATGVTRWTAQVAEPGNSLRGPTHAGQYVLFTGPASVKALDRATGELASEPRSLRGVIFELSHDVATFSIGRANGVRPDDILMIYRSSDDVGDPARVVGQIRATEIGERQSKGVVVGSSLSAKIVTGMHVAADVRLPLQSVKLPFAASSPAVGNGLNLYVGGADQRLYSLDLITGFPNWETTVPMTVTAAPLLVGENLYFASHTGLVTACVIGTGRREAARKKWDFETEGPVFFEMAADESSLYVPSSDRLLYCLERNRGRRLWFKRFDRAPSAKPVLADGRIYQSVADEGIFVLDAKSGKELWHHPEGGQFLAQFGKDAYIYEFNSDHRLLRLDSSSGKIISVVTAPLTSFANASQDGQMILLISSSGRLMCLRPKSAPTLKPAELAAVLRHDARARELAQMSVAERAKLAAREAKQDEGTKRPDLGFLDEDDLLASRNTGKPAGTRGAASANRSEESTEAKKSSDEKEATEDDDSDADEASDDSDDESGDDKEAESDDDDSDDEEAGDDEEESDDDNDNSEDDNDDSDDDN